MGTVWKFNYKSTLKIEQAQGYFDKIDYY